MKYQNFIFDLDGTLADTSPGVYEGVNRTLALMGRDALPECMLRRFVGPPLQESFCKLCGMTEADMHRAVALFRDYYKAEGLYKSALYPGMDALIQTLKRRGGTLMVATLKREEQAITVIEHLGLFPYMSAVVGSDDEGQRTKKDTIDMAMRLSGAADYTASLMIGDSESDAIGAERAGVDFCAATYGFGLTPELIAKHPCAMQIAAPLELLERLDTCEKKDA